MAITLKQLLYTVIGCPNKNLNCNGAPAIKFLCVKILYHVQFYIRPILISGLYNYKKHGCNMEYIICTMQSI